MLRLNMANTNADSSCVSYQISLIDRILKESNTVLSMIHAAAIEQTKK